MNECVKGFPSNPNPKYQRWHRHPGPPPAALVAWLNLNLISVWFCLIKIAIQVS